MATYTTIDLNSGDPQTVFNPSVRTVVTSVTMENGGSTAVAELEITDGSSTAVLTPGQTAGDGIDVVGELFVDKGDTLQIHPTTVEGGAQTNTAVVTHE